MKTPELLVTIASHDYPNADIRVSFPDDWLYVSRFSLRDHEVYLATMPDSDDLAGNMFSTLPTEITASLTTYRPFKAFQPWPQPTLTVHWDPLRDQGTVQGISKDSVYLSPIGQAQAWTGEQYAVLWECYLHDESAPTEDWYQFWRAIEQQLHPLEILTPRLEPNFADSYQEFLYQLDYTPIDDTRFWWHKLPA